MELIKCSSDIDTRREENIFPIVVLNVPTANQEVLLVHPSIDGGIRGAIMKGSVLLLLLLVVVRLAGQSIDGMLLF